MKEAEIALTHILDCDRASLYLEQGLKLDKEKSRELSQVFLRRVAFEPLQYILGQAEFMGLDFKVNNHVLIPRPETEILVETAARYMKGVRSPQILDLGTGSGCIGISLSRMLAGSSVSASDISAAAIEVAKANAREHSAKIEFLQGDMFAALDNKSVLYDLIVSNPPYIAKKDFSGLALELSYEPLMALDGGDSGLDYYRRIADGVSDYLKPRGLLMLEVGFGQYAHVEGLLRASEKFEILEKVNDYNSIARVLVARKEA